MAEIKMTSIEEALKRLGLKPSGEMQIFTTDLAKQYMNPFVPTSGGDGRGLRGQVFPVDYYTALEYRVPYGHYQYQGILYVDPITGKGAFFNKNWGFWSRPGVNKVPDKAGRKLKYSNPTASAKWDEKMIEVSGHDFFSAIQNYFDRRYLK